MLVFVVEAYSVGRFLLTGFLLGTPSERQLTRIFQQNTLRQQIRASATKNTLRTKHRDRGPRQFTMDCRSAACPSSRGGDHCRKARYLRGVEIQDGQD